MRPHVRSAKHETNELKLTTTRTTRARDEENLVESTIAIIHSSTRRILLFSFESSELQQSYYGRHYPCRWIEIPLLDIVVFEYIWPLCHVSRLSAETRAMLYLVP